MFVYKGEILSTTSFSVTNICSYCKSKKTVYIFLTKHETDMSNYVSCRGCGKR